MERLKKQRQAYRKQVEKLHEITQKANGILSQEETLDNEQTDKNLKKPGPKCDHTGLEYGNAAWGDPDSD